MYRPRTQSKKFLDGDCPKGVLAIYDNGGKTFDRYTVFYKPVEPLENLRGWIGYRGMSEHPSSPQGFGIYEEMEAHKAARYRERVYRESAKWSELPDEVKAVVRRDCAEMEKWSNES
jgi:hypothetical protein